MCQRTVSTVKRKIGFQRNSVGKRKFSRYRPMSELSAVSKVIEQIDVEHPSAHRKTSRTCRVSLSAVSRIIKSVNFVLRKKCQVHKSTSLNVEKRCQRAFRPYRQLTNQHYKNFVTTDKSWFHLDGTATEGE